MTIEPGPPPAQRDELAPVADRPERRHRIKQLEVMVADVINETPDTTTLVLFTGNDRLEYEAGHFLTVDPHQFDALERFTAFLEDVKGRREPPRAYSLSSAPHERYLAFTVKEERYVSGVTRYPPLLSPLLVKRTPRGTRMVVTGFTGPYTLPADAESRAKTLIHVCAGSGIVPNLSILKHALAERPVLEHVLVYSNRTWEDVIFRSELAELAERHSGRLRIVHLLTRESDAGRFGAGVRRGRVDAALLRDTIPDPSACLVLVCGPAVSPWEKQAAREKGAEPAPRFMESALLALAELGVPKDRVLRESYG
ncbi:MAG TPA: oxidoreductase [Vicinamibacteria bacterium]|nr:oxidoreductase [Vicinamibacteria bacterium]